MSLYLYSGPELPYALVYTETAQASRVLYAQSRRPRSSLRPRSPTSPTPSDTAQCPHIIIAQDCTIAPRQSQERSCNVRRQHNVSALMHMGCGPTMAAHLRARPAPTTAAPASEAIIDRAPLKNDELGKRGSGHLGPDTPAGQKLITTTISKAMVQEGRDQGSQLRVCRSYWSQRRPLTPL